MTLLVYFLLFVLLRSAASDDTQFAFHSFPSENDKIVAFGHAAHNGANRSYIINGRATQSRGTCGALSYAKKVRIQEVANGRVASFSTSFTFTFETLGLSGDNSSFLREKDSNGVSFSFVRNSSKGLARVQDLMSIFGNSGACTSPYDPGDPKYINYTPSGFLVFFGSGTYNFDSDNARSFIRVARALDYEYEIPSYTHYLCDKDTKCSYFSDGKIFTAWINFDSSARILEVWLANGSIPSVEKPLQPLLRILNYKLAEMLGDEVIPTFWGTSDVHKVEAHELLSWNFSSSEIANAPSSQTPNHFWKVRMWASTNTGVLGSVVAAVVAILWCASRLANPSKNARYTPLDHNAGPHVFSYAELRKATDNFHERNLLGIGGSGSVYKGSFEAPSGTHLVAVKRINFSAPKQAESLFYAEVTSLGQVRHRNVVQLQGWCQEKGRLLLVYDFMSNGGLNEWLHTLARHGHEDQQMVLSLERRHSILQGVGAALEYLHEDCLSCVLHRDIKSSNVLLDAGFKAHLGDFGLARLIDHHKLDKTTLAAGTLGYMAPELPYTGKATKESDVYSFGILMLEVICGRRPLDMQASEPEDTVLLHTVWRAYEGGSLLNVVDSRLLQHLQSLRFTPKVKDEIIDAIGSPSLSIDSNTRSYNNVPRNSMVVDVDVQFHTIMVVDLLRLGLLCCLPNPKARPFMEEVNGILQQIGNMENASTITNTSMPFLPSTKPTGLYDSLEFSETSPLSFESSPTVEASTKLYVDGSLLE